MKRIHLLVVAGSMAVLSTPSFADADYDCSGVGLRLTSDSAMLGDIVLKQCLKKGVWRTYAEDCSPNAKTAKLVFDEVTLRAQFVSSDGEERVLRCRRSR